MRNSDRCLLERRSKPLATEVELRGAAMRASDDRSAAAKSRPAWKPAAATQRR